MGMDWSFLFGQVRFQALGGRYERFIGECTAEGIPVQKIRPCPGGITGCVAARRYRQLHPLARRNHVRLRVQKKRGLPFAARHVRGRWGLLVGPVAFCAAIVMMQQLVWSVQYVQMKPQQQIQVGQALCQMGLSPGAVADPDKVRAVQQRLALERPELGWLSLNFIKGRLVVESAPALPVPAVEGNEPVRLIAAADGVVCETNVQEGWCDLRPGQTVAQGQVLVSPAKLDHQQQMISGHAKGRVIAQVKKTYECTQPRKYTVSVPSGQVQTIRSLHLAGLVLPMQRNVPPKDVQRKAYRPLTFLGFSLPATVEESICVPVRLLPQELSEQAAREFADYACRQALRSEFPDAQLLAVDTDETMTQDACTLRMTVEFRANIAKAE